MARRSDTTHYLWHHVPLHMRGHQLWPLKALAEVEPEIAAHHRAKYQGREHIAELYIPLLDCRWDEVIFLSPIHPQLLTNAMEEAGHSVHGRSVYQIPSEILSEHEVVWFDPKKSGPKGEVTPASVWKWNMASHTSQQLSDQAMPYYQQCLASGRRPLILATELHVIVRGYTRDGRPNPIDISAAEIITTNARSSAMHSE